MAAAAPRAAGAELALGSQREKAGEILPERGDEMLWALRALLALVSDDAVLQICHHAKRHALLELETRGGRPRGRTGVRAQAQTISLTGRTQCLSVPAHNTPSTCSSPTCGRHLIGQALALEHDEHPPAMRGPSAHRRELAGGSLCRAGLPPTTLQSSKSSDRPCLMGGMVALGIWLHQRQHEAAESVRKQSANRGETEQVHVAAYYPRGTSAIRHRNRSSSSLTAPPARDPRTLD